MADIASYRESIEREVAQCFDEFNDRLPSELSAQSTWALAAAREYCLRPSGKRIRGSLAAHVAQEVGDCSDDLATKLGAYIELMHNYLLVVDDVADQSMLRRGRPTIHERFIAEDHSSISRFDGEMIAINIGIMLQHIASWYSTKMPLDPALFVQLSAVMNTNIAITGFGQIDDVYQRWGREGIDGRAIVRKYEQKSGYYTFVNPLQCGLLVGGKTDQSAKAAALRYGLPAGTAFQLHDDYSGIFADPAVTGKNNYDDIREGTYTFLVHSALENANTDDRATLLALLGDPNASEGSVAIVRDIFTRTGAKKKTEEKIDQEIQLAQDAAMNGQDVWGSVVGDCLSKLVDGLRVGQKGE